MTHEMGAKPAPGRFVADAGLGAGRAPADELDDRLDLIISTWSLNIQNKTVDVFGDEIAMTSN